MRVAEAFVGVLSDTHGLLRPEALEAMEGAERILHAGDVEDAAILDALGRMAPVTAVRGNVDRGIWSQSLPMTQTVDIGGALVHMVHDIETLGLDPAAAGLAAVVYGHSHRPEATYRDGVLFLNPGSAGPRRFDLPVTVARLRAGPEGLQAEIVELRV